MKVLNAVTNFDDLSQIVHALEAIYESNSSNETRKDATIYLERAKTQPEAPERGFALAVDTAQLPVVRYYGLSLLEYPIRYRWEDYSSEQTLAVRRWIIQLAQGVREEDPLFLRNKIAQLWVEVAIRAWVGEWLDMDELLYDLWQRSWSHQEVVLHVLETLADQIFSKEDPAAGIRGAELGRACVEIFISARELTDAYPTREASLGMRYGEEGWLQRLSTTLSSCLNNNIEDLQHVRMVAVKVIVVIRSVMPWIMLKAVSHTHWIELLGKALAVPDASVEALHALYHRSQYGDDDVVDLVCPLFSTEGVELLRSTYNSYYIDIEDLDEEKYWLLQKLSETMCALGTFFEQRPELVAKTCDVSRLLDLLMIMLQNPSLVVSVPVLYLWTKLLASPFIGDSAAVTKLAGVLLETCSRRLFRYEALDPDCSDTTFAFLNEDFETMPERHAFIGNYRRYCVEIIQCIVQKSPFQAIRHILNQADNVFQTLYPAEERFHKDSFNSNSWAVLRADAQCTVVATAMKAYLTWAARREATGLEQLHKVERKSLQGELEGWCQDILRAELPDPIIEKRILQLVVEISVKALPSVPSLAFKICKQVLANPPTTESSFTPYDEALKDLDSVRPRELQKLAMNFPDSIFSIFQTLCTGVENIVSLHGVGQRVKLEYQAILFIIVQNASTIDETERTARLDGMIKPTLHPWHDPALEHSLSNFDSFCELLGLGRYPSVFLRYESQNIQDWSGHSLDQEGQNLRAEILSRCQKLPLQATRSLLTASTDRVRPGTKAYDVMRLHWQDGISTILPKLLQFVRHSQAFNNPEKWSNFPPEMQQIISRTVMDRVWQSGISTESRDDFYARIRESRSTLEGLASTVRKAVREVRELSYWILHCMCQFGDIFYAIQDLPEPLAHALYADAHALSAHQLVTLLTLSAAVIDGCPTRLRSHFLPPLLIHLFKQLDVKISADWDLIGREALEDAAEETLDQEMKAESVLRQLTHSAVLMVSKLLDLQKQEAREQLSEDTTLRFIILTSPDILEALILFCTHAVRMHDYRCCGIITRVLRNLIPQFRETSSSSPNAETPSIDVTTASQVREFFSTEVLKACITSLNEPYFHDLQKDLAALIASILVLYSPTTDTPRQTLLSMPGMSEGRVDKCLENMRKARNDKEQRSYVLTLLESVRGVSIHEQGKISNRVPRGGRKGRRSAMQEQFMAMDDEQATGIVRGGSPELVGITDMFG